MCQGCWFHDHGAPMVNTDEVLVAAELIRRLYEDHKQYTGGPLHSMLDNMNIDDEQIESDYYTSGDYAKRTTFEGVPDGTGKWVHHDDLRCTPEVKELCELILYAFRQMPESHRAAAIAWYSGWAARYAEVQANGQVASEASADEVASLVAVWTEAKNVPQPEPGAVKACVSIPCPPFSGQVTGVVYPGPGQVFAPNAKITGRGIVESSVNSDGSATITWSPPPAAVGDALSSTPRLLWSEVTVGHPGEAIDFLGDLSDDTLRAVLDDPRQIRPTYPDREDGS